jgi:hypothetical protein
MNPATMLHSSISKAALELTHLRLLPYLVTVGVASNSYPVEKSSGRLIDTISILIWNFTSSTGLRFKAELHVKLKAISPG